MMTRPNIEAIKGRAEEAAMLGVMAYESDVIALLAYVAELEKIAQAVARFDDDESYDGAYKCHWCGRSYTLSDDTITHAADCPVIIARQLLSNQASRTLGE